MTSFASIVSNITILLCQIIGMLFVLATVIFLWGIIKYIISQGSENELQAGRQYIIYGLIGLFVMVSMWGIINAAAYTFFGNAGDGFNQCTWY